MRKRLADAAFRAKVEAARCDLVKRTVGRLSAIGLSATRTLHELLKAKSEAVRRVARAAGGRYFEYLLGRFTEPSEIFGPIDLRRLREGVVETETTSG